MKLQDYWRQLLQMPGADTPVVRWGLFLSLLVVLWRLLIDPFFSWQQTHTELLQSKGKEASRLLALQAEADTWKQAAEKFQQAYLQSARGLFQESTATAALAQLQSLLNTLIERHRLKLENRRLLEVSPEPGVGERLPVSLRLLGSTASLIDFLHDLAHQEKIIVVEHLHMGEHRQMMIAQLQVAAFRLTTDTPPNPPGTADP